MQHVTDAPFAKRNRRGCEGFGRTAAGEVEQESALVTADFSGLQTVPATRNAASEMNASAVLEAITRGKKLVVLIGQQKALAMAAKNNRTENWFSGLLAKLIA
jgi:hypothetical protein